MIELPLGALKEALEIAFYSKTVPIVRSSPGIGKTSIARQLAADLNLKVIDIRLAQCDPTDLNGFPQITNGKASYVPMDTFPLEGDELPIKEAEVTKVVAGKTQVVKPAVRYNGWMIIYDEITSASKAVQAAAYKILLEKEVGQRKLHRNVFQIGLGNKETDNAIVQRMSTALQSRMQHFTVTTDHTAWVNHAANSGFDYRVIAFIQSRPELLNKFNPNHNDHTFPCERTWEFVSQTVKGIEKYQTKKNKAVSIGHEHQYLIAGCVSEGPALEFISFCQIYGQLVPLTSIIASPMTVPVPHEPSAVFAMASLIGEKIDDTNVDPLMKYLSRLPLENQIIAVRMFYKSKPSLTANPAVSSWITRNVNNLRD